MKPAQWIALLGVVAGMVFGVTFLGSSFSWRKGTGPGVAPQARLTFADPVTSFPAPPSLPAPGEAPSPMPMLAECEVGQPQRHDFWFKNDNPRDLPVGVLSKTCQCTSVLLFLAKDRKDVPAPDQRDQAAKDLEATAAPTELKDDSAMVPAGAVGVVRLTWTDNQAEAKSLAAKLWMGEKGAGPNQDFEIRSLFVNPLRTEPAIDRAEPAVNAGTFSVDQLPQTVNVLCWSSTRSQFHLEVRRLHGRWKEESDPLEIGKPEPLNEAELAQLRKDPRHGTVLTGYKTPVTLRRRSPDGKNAFDLGPFHQRLELKAEAGAPVVVVVRGMIQGDLGPTDEKAVPVQFDPFYRTEEASHPVTLTSGRDVIWLELDRERTPEFLDVKFPEGPEINGARKTWTLQVKWVPKSGASGDFPDDRDGYRDSAVYIRPVYAKTDGPPPPCLRIPVTGKADTR